MYAQTMHPGYSSRRLSPASLAVAIGINGAILAALLLAAPTITERVETHLHTRNIPLDPPPPEPLVKPKMAPTKLVNPAPQPDPIAPDRVVDTPATDLGLHVTNLPQEPVPPGPAGTGVALDPPTPPAPPPVMTGAEIDPRFADAFQPTYPGEERRAGREGRVTVRVRIGADGRVREVQRVSATSDAFFEATQRRALDKWRFRPATRDGVAIEAWRTMSVRFVLDGE